MGVVDFAQTLVREGDVTYVSTASGSITDADRYYIGTYNGLQTLTLPSAVGRIGQRFYVKKELGGSGPLTVTSAGGTIDGATSEVISVGAGFRQFVSDGTNWRIFGGNIMPVIVQLTQIATGNITIDASLGTIYRITVTGASCTVVPPAVANAVDADTVNLEILCNAACTVTFGTGTAPATIIPTGAAWSSLTVQAGKRMFVTMRYVAGVAWFLLGATTH
jgi:hypothetical protein